MVTLSRVLIPLLCPVVWSFVYLNARCAYRFQRTTKKLLIQLSLTLAVTLLFLLQVRLMNRFIPGDIQARYFENLVFIECGGALVVMFWELLRERAKAKARSQQ